MPRARVWTVNEVIEYTVQHLTCPDGMFDVDRLMGETVFNRLPYHIRGTFDLAENELGELRVDELTGENLFESARLLDKREAKIYFRILQITLWFALTDKVKGPRFGFTEAKLKRLFREAKALFRNHNDKRMLDNKQPAPAIIGLYDNIPSRVAS